MRKFAWSDLLVVAAAVLAMGLLRGVYSNELLLFNFIIFFTLAQGLNVIYGFTGYLPFGYVGFYGAGAYGFALAVMHLNAPPLLAMLCGAVAAVLLGIVLIPLMRLSGAYFAIANLAAAQATYEVIANPDAAGHHQGAVRRFSERRVRAGVFLLRRARRHGADAAAGGLAAQLTVWPVVAGDPGGSGQCSDGGDFGGACAHHRLAAVGADRRTGGWRRSPGTSRCSIPTAPST